MSLAAAGIPSRINFTLAAAIVTAHALALLVLPLLGAPTAACVVALALVALVSPMQWALIHEAIHGLLLPARDANTAAGRVLAICFGAPFRALRFAHLRHHRYNRTPQGREEVYDPARCSHLAARAEHYLRISIGLYFGELALCLLCWLPTALLRPRLVALCPDLDPGSPGMARLVDRELLDRAPMARIRFDAACVLVLYVAAFWLYGTYWLLVAACLAVRGFLASQFDHAPHHATPLDRRDYALNMHAPGWLRAWLLNFNLHRTHHLQPHLPWVALPAATQFEAGDISFVRAVLRQWRGPIALTRAETGESGRSISRHRRPGAQARSSRGSQASD